MLSAHSTLPSLQLLIFLFPFIPLFFFLSLLDFPIATTVLHHPHLCIFAHLSTLRELERICGNRSLAGPSTRMPYRVGTRKESSVKVPSASLYSTLVVGGGRRQIVPILEGISPVRVIIQ